MPVVHETDRRFDELGAAISRQFMDVNGKIETTRNPRDRDPYTGDGRTALGDAQVTHHCANCEATERRNAQLKVELAKHQEMLRAAQADAAVARDLVESLSEDTNCRFDHNGHCQEHGWFSTEERCVNARACELIKSPNPGALLLAELEALRTAVIAYVAARDREENSSEQALIDDLSIWGATEDAFAALKAAAGIDAKEES